jgi:hypothetical protein
MAAQAIFAGLFDGAMNSSRRLSGRVMSAECHRQELLATFFSTRDFYGRNQAK